MAFFIRSCRELYNAWPAIMACSLSYSGPLRCPEFLGPRYLNRSGR
jgi:hypothetical protein